MRDLAPPALPQVDLPDLELNAKQHIDRLMRRVVLVMFALGVVAVLTIWAMESADGTLEPFNRVGYPAMVTVFTASLLGLWRRPQLLGTVRWAGFLCMTGVLLADLWSQVIAPVPMLTNYNVVTLLNWLPLCYAIAFFMLETRQAAVAAAAVLAFLCACAALRANAPTRYAGQDGALMINTLMAHAVLVTCLTGLLWLKRVVNAQGEQAAQLNHLAVTDPLTGLANRRRTLRQLEDLTGAPAPGLAPAILLADLDHFKHINDQHGHETGDRVLVAVAGALRAATREADTISRWGGEEFLILLPRTAPGEALELAERLRARIEALVILDPVLRPVSVTISIGLALHEDDQDGAAWLRRADEALYRAKAAGRNRCEIAPRAVEPPLPRRPPPAG
jgi:diguanylate cyclase (GGDEF)-like protein